MLVSLNAQGVDCISKVEGSLNREVYLDVFETDLIPLRDILALSDGWIFQQDNSTCHTSWVVKQWLQAEKITSMGWPIQSPDLNPIENLWDHVKRAVQQQNLTKRHRAWDVVKTTCLKFRINDMTNFLKHATTV